MGKVGKRVTIALVALIVVFFVSSFFIDRYMLDQTFAKHDAVIEAGGSMPTFEDYADTHTRTPIEFTVDGGTLRGYIYEANATAQPKGFVVFRHGIYSNHGFYLPEIIALTDRGWTVMAYDALGAGLSDGDSYLGMPQSAIDVTEAVVFASREGYVGDLPVVLWGHSWGGYGVAAALYKVPWVKACVTMSGFDEPLDVMMEFANRMVGGFAITQVPTMWLNTKLAFGDDADLTAVKGINYTSAPVLVIHGTDDKTVEYAGSSIISERARITNEKVEYYEPSEEGRNGHNTYFYTAESNAYGAQKRAELAALNEQYPDGLPEDVKKAFYADYDALRANTPDPVLMDTIDEFLTRAIGGNTMTEPETTTTQPSGDAKDPRKNYGALVSVEFSDSGNSLGNLYNLETVIVEDGTMMVVEREAAMHSDPTTVREYRAPEDIVSQAEAIVDSSGMRDWGELPMSEFFVYDASTERLSLTFNSADPTYKWHLYLSMTEYDVQPDDGEAFKAIRDLLMACLVEENLIREYVEPLKN